MSQVNEPTLKEVSEAYSRVIQVIVELDRYKVIFDYKDLWHITDTLNYLADHYEDLYKLKVSQNSSDTEL